MKVVRACVYVCMRSIAVNKCLCTFIVITSLFIRLVGIVCVCVRVLYPSDLENAIAPVLEIVEMEAAEVQEVLFHVYWLQILRFLSFNHLTDIHSCIYFTFQYIHCSLIIYINMLTVITTH